MGYGVTPGQGVTGHYSPECYPDVIVLPARLYHCLTAVRDRPCPGYPDPFDLNHAIFDNQAGVSLVRDIT